MFSFDHILLTKCFLGYFSHISAPFSMDYSFCPNFQCTDSISYSVLARAPENDIVEWLKGHKLVFQSVSCSKRHETRICLRKGDHWVCPDRLCRSRTYHMEPLLGSFGRRTPSQILQVLYGMANGNGRDQLTLETLLSSQTVTELTKKLERIVASVYEMRTAAARGTVTIMQKDETCFSKPKRGGNNRPARIRQGGSTWANVLTQTSRSRKAEQIFVSTLEDRRSSSTNDPVFELAASERTIVHTDGWRGSNALGNRLNHGTVNHRRHWVDPVTGVHTQTAERMNGMLKKEVRIRGNGTLGSGVEARDNRLKFAGEVVNGKLKRGEQDGHALRRLFQDVKWYCENVEIVLE